MKLAMIFWRIALIVILVVLVLAPYGYADEIPKGWEASDMRPIGYSDLAGRGGAFKMAIRQVNGRCVLFSGTSGIMAGPSST